MWIGEKFRKNLAKSIVLSLCLGVAAISITPSKANADTFNNNTLPTGGSFIHGTGSLDHNGNIFNISQNDVNAVIKWDNFSIGANAVVNFNSVKDNFNTLNYVNGGNVSQIYGTINAKNGNIFIVNPSGVQIGNSAQINVGSLYVSNKKLNENDLGKFDGTLNNIGVTGTNNAELMSLGNINANKVTFEGDRIVLDTDRIINKADIKNPQKANITVNSTDENNVVLGYSSDQNTNLTPNISVSINGNNADVGDYKYQWIKNLDDLQGIGDNSTGKFALRNSIDAIATSDKDPDTNFTPIKNFGGKLDGLGYNIFGLTIDGGTEKNTGLFATTSGATLKNFDLISGKVTGNENVGALVGSAANTTIENVANTLDVSGQTNIGGLVGSATYTNFIDVKNTGAISGSQNVGGLVGSMSGGTLVGTAGSAHWARITSAMSAAMKLHPISAVWSAVPQMELQSVMKTSKFITISPLKADTMSAVSLAI